MIRKLIISAVTMAMFLGVTLIPRESPAPTSLEYGIMVGLIADTGSIGLFCDRDSGLTAQELGVVANNIANSNVLLDREFRGFRPESIILDQARSGRILRIEMVDCGVFILGDR